MQPSSLLCPERASRFGREAGFTVDLREFSSAAPDRRQAPRTKLVEIAYIGMGPENGGLVLDVSDGGLSFHSVAPLQRSEQIQFLLSLRGHSRIEGTGEVVWTNEMRTICGLKFISLSNGAREHISSWTNPSKTAPAREKAPAPKPPLAAAKTNEETAGTLAPSPAPVFAIRPAYDAAPLTAEQRETIWREPLFLWAVFAMLGAAIGFGAYKYGVQAGRAEASAVQTAAPAAPQSSPAVAAPAPALPALPASPAPAEQVRSAPVEPPPVPNNAKPITAGAFVNASKTEASPSAATQAVTAEAKLPSAATDHSEQQLQAGETELAAAEAYLNGTSGPRDTTKAARLLWAAVGNGNSQAEVLLADLYARGDGVTKNCEQGRILLIAAIKSGNIEAHQRLKNLNGSGCQ